jgi:hypothetical protein
MLLASVRKSGVDTRFGACPVVFVARIDRTLFCTDETKNVGSAVRKLRLVGARSSVFPGGWRSQSKVFLWLREHVHAPGADNAVGRGSEDIMRNRGANNTNVVNRVGMAKVGGRHGRFSDWSTSSTRAASTLQRQT